MSSERFVASNFDRDYLKVVLLGGLDCGVLGRMLVPDEIRPRPPLFPATLSERRSSAVPFRGPAAWECLGPSSVRAFPNFRRITSLARRPQLAFSPPEETGVERTPPASFGHRNGPGPRDLAPPSSIFVNWRHGNLLFVILFGPDRIFVVVFRVFTDLRAFPRPEKEML